MPLDTCITNVGEYFSSHYLDSTFANAVEQLNEISFLVSFNGVEQILGARVEVMLELRSRISKVVYKSSLLDEIVLFIDTNKLHLLL